MRIRSLAISAAFCALAASAASAQGQVPNDPFAGMRQACRPDVRRFCAGVQPGEGRLIICLRQNYSSISPECREAMTAANPRRRS
jgi:hypothetical protein